MDVATTIRCPQCSAEVPVLEGYVTWCDQCGWNLKPPESIASAETPLERVAASLGRRAGQRLAEEVARSPSLEPRLTPSKLAAYAIAAGVHAVVLALISGGALLIALTWANPVLIVVGAFAILLGWVMRPRLPHAPREGRIDRSDAPTLYALAEEISAALETRPADLVVISDQFNASWSVAGIRRRRVLTLGLPLATVLESAELVALVAHELAHGRNGDVTRGLVVGSAIDGLATLYWVLEPRGDEDDLGELAFFGWIVNGIMWLLSRPVRWVLALETVLLLRDSQRAEYLADALAASVAGTLATVAVHEKLLLGTAFEAAIQRRVYGRGAAGVDLFDEVRTVLRAVPERERERRLRVALLEGTRLSDTHPPTGRRIDLLLSRERREARVVLAGQDERIRNELLPLRADLERRLLDAYRDSLYAGARPA